MASMVSEIERSSEGRGGLGGFVNIEEVGPGGWDEEHHSHQQGNPHDADQSCLNNCDGNPLSLFAGARGFA